jgi:hypothetical protein
MKFTTAFLMITIFGCMPAVSIHEQLREDSSVYLKCPAEEISIDRYTAPTFLYNAHQWLATGCGQTISCTRSFSVTHKKPWVDCRPEY